MGTSHRREEGQTAGVRQVPGTPRAADASRAAGERQVADGRPVADGRQTAGVRQVACVGTGLIGARWAAQFLAAGFEVTATDPSPGAEERLQTDIAAAWPALERLGRTKSAQPPGLVFTPDLETAVADADWVQESVPDIEALKLEVLRRIDAACPPQAVIASSTSGILPTLLQSVCAHPERVLVGHPFNPVHLLPLVEVVGGEQTSAQVIESAMTFYESLGKKPLHCRVEAPGFIANRLQEAIYREAFHLVNDGIATTAELDASIFDGPGLRWALFGPAMVYLLQGGRGGMEHAIRQFNPDHVDDWAHIHYPELTDELINALHVQTKEQAEGRSLAEWEALRDEFLIRVLQLRDEITTPDAKPRSALPADRL